MFCVRLYQLKTIEISDSDKVTNLSERLTYQRHTLVRSLGH